MLRKLEIHSVATTVSKNDEGALILLREKNGDRMLPLRVPLRNAVMLMTRDKMNMPFNLPVSIGDISVQMMRKFGIEMSYVELTAILDGSFICRIVCHRGEEETQAIEHCTAVDGLTLAVVSHCPIVIEDELLEMQYMHKIGDQAYAVNINNLSRKLIEDALDNAIATENYELASQLRDELKRRTAEENEAALNSIRQNLLDHPSSPDDDSEILPF